MKVMEDILVESGDEVHHVKDADPVFADLITRRPETLTLMAKVFPRIHEGEVMVVSETVAGVRVDRGRTHTEATKAVREAMGQIAPGAVPVLGFNVEGRVFAFAWRLNSMTLVKEPGES